MGYLWNGTCNSIRTMFNHGGIWLRQSLNTIKKNTWFQISLSCNTCHKGVMRPLRSTHNDGGSLFPESNNISLIGNLWTYSWEHCSSNILRKWSEVSSAFSKIVTAGKRIESNTKNGKLPNNNGSPSGVKKSYANFHKK